MSPCSLTEHECGRASACVGLSLRPSLSFSNIFTRLQLRHLKHPSCSSPFWNCSQRCPWIKVTTCVLKEKSERKPLPLCCSSCILRCFSASCERCSFQTWITLSSSNELWRVSVIKAIVLKCVRRLRLHLFVMLNLLLPWELTKLKPSRHFFQNLRSLWLSVSKLPVSARHSQWILFVHTHKTAAHFICLWRCLGLPRVRKAQLILWFHQSCDDKADWGIYILGLCDKLPNISWCQFV